MLWNPAPGVHLAGSDLIRNAILAVFLRRSLREQESAYRDAWLDPLERRVSRAGPGGSKSLDDAFPGAFLVDDARARGARAPARWRCAFERDLEAMMASDATPEDSARRSAKDRPRGYTRDFKASAEEIGTGVAHVGEDDAARAARSARINLGVGGGARRDFDFTTSAPPAKYEPEHAEEGHVPEEIDRDAKARRNDEAERTNATSATRPSTRAPWEGPAPTGIPVEGTDANVDAAARAAAAVPVTERACREGWTASSSRRRARAGFFGSEDAEKERECRYADRYQ